jgi:hypothetical protein
MTFRTGVDLIGITIYVMMNQFGFGKNHKRKRGMGRWVENHRKKRKKKVINTKDNNDF